MDFADMAKMKEVMGKAREMQAQMEQKLAATVVEADAGGGMVSVRMNGKKEVLRVKIEPTALSAAGGDGGGAGEGASCGAAGAAAVQRGDTECD